LNFRLGRAFLILLLGLTGRDLVHASPQSRRPTVPVEDMTREADVIGVATVLSATVREESRTGVICTDFRLQFSEVWKGDPGREFIMVKPGGQLPNGDKLTLPDHEYTLKPEESVLVFAIPSTYGNHVAIGYGLGLYRVRAGSEPLAYRITEHPVSIGKAPPQTLRALKEQVWRTLGRPGDPAPAQLPPSKSSAAPNPPESGSVAPAALPTAQAPVAPPTEGSRGHGSVLFLGLILILGIVFLFFRKKPDLSP